MPMSRCVHEMGCFYREVEHCGSHQPFFKIDFATLTAASALPLPLGWEGDEVVCLKPYATENVRYCSLMNCGPLSVWQIAGTPYRAK